MTIAPCWERGHLFKKKMNDRGAHYFAGCCVWIPAWYAGYYESMQYFAEQLGMRGLTWQNSAAKGGADHILSKIVIHPGASHPSRRWPRERWTELLQRLAERGFHVTLIGAEQERTFLLQIVGEQIARAGVKVVTGNIDSVMHCLSMADVLIGMDSFSVHAAYSAGVPAVVLNGSADTRVLAPPRSEPLSAGHLCQAYPCYYRYPCRGKEDEYICSRGIEVEEVLAAVNTILTRAKHE